MPSRHTSQTHKIGVLGDIHANLSALQAVLALFDLEGVSEIYSVGDLVGYGPRPNECIELLAERGVRCVAGNHDWAVLGLIDTRCFNRYAAAAAAWTADELTSASRRYLETLPLRIDTADCSVFHASLPQPEEFGYLQSLPAALECLTHFEAPIGFFGHTHVPMAYLAPQDGDGEPEWLLEKDAVDYLLPSSHRGVVNVGSVGQPRDENPLSPGAIYHVASRRVRIVRTQYNVAEERRLIRKVGLPEVLGERLQHGI